MIEGDASTPPGTFRISFDRHLATTSSAHDRRPVQAPSFLNYVYYTDYETLDPAALYNPQQPDRADRLRASTTPTAATTAAARSTSSPAT